MPNPINALMLLSLMFLCSFVLCLFLYLLLYAKTQINTKNTAAKMPNKNNYSQKTAKRSQKAKRIKTLKEQN